MGAITAPVNMVNEKVTKKLNEIIEMFETGNLPPAVARTIIAKDLPRPSNSWSIGNKMLMSLQGTEDARGFKQWQEVNRWVKKGAKAIYILAPKKRTITVTVLDSETGEKNKEKRQIITGFYQIPVFRYEDTDGEPLPARQEYKPPKLPPLQDVAKHFGVDVIYAPFDGRSYGFYSWTGGKKIVLHTHDIRTWFHELGHAVHNTFYTLRNGQVPEQEIVAELFAATMCELHGIHGFHQYSWDYIKSYTGNDPAAAVQTIFQILSDVEECILRVMAVADIPALKIS
jgi:hypothetical protein